MNTQKNTIPNNNHQTPAEKAQQEALFTLLQSNQEVFYKKIFGKQYTTEHTIDFAKLKKYIKNIWIDRPFKNSTPEEICDKMAKKPLKDRSLSSLEAFNGNRELKYLLRHTFNKKSLHNAKEKYGIQFIFWLWRIPTHESEYRDFKTIEEIIFQDLCKGKQEDYEDLMRITHAQQRILNNESMYDTLKQRETTKNINTIKETFDTKNQEIMIQKLTTKDKTYAYGPAKDHNNISPNERHDIYLDGPIGIGLFHNNRPVAYCTYLIQNNSMLINQLQRNTYYHFDKYGISRERRDKIMDTYERKETLYKILLDIAHMSGIKHITIQGGANNKRTKTYHKPVRIKKRYPTKIDWQDTRQRLVPEGTPHLSVQTAQKIYDKFAKEKGFTHNKEDGNRHKIIS